MWYKHNNKNPIVNLALLLALASTPVMTNLFKSDYVLAQSRSGTPSFPLPTAVPNGTKIRMDASRSMIWANEALKEGFEKKYSGTTVEITNNGTDEALQALQEGKIDIAAIARRLTPKEEKQGLAEQLLRREKIAIIVGKDNPFKGNLTNEQFARIYRGQITNWSQLGRRAGKIRVIDRPDSSDTREAFRNYPVFKGKLFKTGSNATQLDNDDPAEVIKELGNDGIGFVLANQVSKLDNVRILSLHNTLPDNPKYPFSQPLVYVFKKNPPEAVKNFVGFATAAPGKEAIDEAREQEAVSVAQAVAQRISSMENATATASVEATAAATPTPRSTETATTDTEEATADKKTVNNSADAAATETVGAATNTSASGNEATGEQALIPATSAGASTEAAEGTMRLWWFLLPIAVGGALGLWWLLGRRKSQEDDTVARGVLPDDAPPPFTPTSTSGSGAVKQPVANQPIGGAATTIQQDTVEMNAAPVEPASNTTAEINSAAIATGVAGLGVAAAVSSSNQEDTENPVAEADLELPDAASDLQQPDVSNIDSLEAPDLQQPDIADSGLDLEAPAAVVKSSYLSLPSISNPTDGEAPPTTSGDADNTTSSQEELSTSGTNNWLGNFALGGAAAAGAAKIKYKLALKNSQESPSSESTGVNQAATDETATEAQLNQVDQTNQYPPLPDVWETPQTEPSSSDVQENSSFSLDSTAAAAAGLNSGLLNQENDPTSDESHNTEENQLEEQPTVIQQTTTPDSEVQENSSVSLDGVAAAAARLNSGLLNQENDPTSDESHNTEENQLQEQPTVIQQTTTPDSEVQKKSSFPLGGVAAAAAGLAAGAAALGSGLLNRHKHDTSEHDNNAQENQVEEQPKEQFPGNEQTNTTGVGGFATGEFLNDVRQDNITQSDRTEASSIPEEQPQVTQETPSVTTADLPEVRITTSNEQLADAQTPPQEQQSHGLPNVWVTPPNSEPLVTQETVSPQQVAPSEVSSNSEDNLASAGGAVLAAASQMVGDNQKSQNQDDAKAAEDIALDKVADAAETDTNVLNTQHTRETSISLINRTPKWAYASWNISENDRLSMLDKGATQLVLRLYDVTDIDLSYQDGRLVQKYDCEETVSHRYVAIPNTEKDYIAEIGYVTTNKEWLFLSRSPIIRVFNRPHKDFWFEADVELIIHGATEPGSTAIVDGKNIKVKPDGTFHLRIPFTENSINYLITAVAPDTEEGKTIDMQFQQSEWKNS